MWKPSPSPLVKLFLTNADESVISFSHLSHHERLERKGADGKRARTHTHTHTHTHFRPALLSELSRPNIGIKLSTVI